MRAIFLSVRYAAVALTLACTLLVSSPTQAASPVPQQAVHCIFAALDLPLLPLLQNDAVPSTQESKPRAKETPETEAEKHRKARQELEEMSGEFFFMGGLLFAMTLVAIFWLLLKRARKRS